MQLMLCVVFMVGSLMTERSMFSLKVTLLQDVAVAVAVASELVLLWLVPLHAETDAAMLFLLLVRGRLDTVQHLEHRRETGVATNGALAGPGERPRQLELLLVPQAGGGDDVQRGHVHCVSYGCGSRRRPKDHFRER